MLTLKPVRVEWSMVGRRRRLLGGLALLAALLLLAGAAGVFGAERATRVIQTVHDDRVVPLHQFFRIVQEYRVNVLDAVREIEEGRLDWERGRTRVLAARSRVDAMWRSYTTTYLVEEENAVVRELAPRMSRVSGAIGELEAPLRARDLRALREMLTVEIQPELELIFGEVSRLADVQVAVARREKDRNVARENIIRGVASASILAGICLAGLIALMTVRLFDDLRRSYSELEKAQTALVEREKASAIGELAAVVAHEVRNPLGVIFNCVSSLRRGAGADTPVVLRILQEEADRVERIVKNLLEFSKPQKLQLRPESMGELLVGARQQVAHRASAAGVELRVDIPSDAPVVFADAGLINQALVNLLLNGIEAAPQGGHVTVLGSLDRASGHGAVRIDVVDDGPGIAPEDQKKIFQPFFTTKPTGTGLGLALVKRVIEAHGGEILVSSSSSRGTRFTILLPETPTSEVRPVGSAA